MKTMIYIFSNNSHLYILGNVLFLMKKMHKIFEIPINNVKSIMLYTNVEIDYQTLSILLENNISLCYVKYGKIIGKMVPETDRYANLRHTQYHCLNNEKWRVASAINCIKVKIENMKSVTKSLLSGKKTAVKLCKPLDSCLKKLKNAKSIVQVMGIEGAASKYYFQIYGQSFTDEFGFVTRNKRPALDPTNALLNLGYMCVYYDLKTHIEAHGLDPYCSFLHGIENSRASFALDLIEPLRQSIVDPLVRTLITKKALQLHHFDSSNGFQLTKEGLSIFYKIYHEKMGVQDGINSGFRHKINQQLQLLEKSLKENRAYKFL